MRYRVVGSAILVGFVVILFLCFRNGAEPRYKGKTLSDWANGLTAWPVSNRSGSAEEQWTAAIDHLRGEAVPTLVKWLNTEPGVWWSLYAKIERALPMRWRSSLMAAQLRERLYGDQMRMQRAWLAHRALIRLGKDAIPAMVRSLSVAKVQARAVAVLAGMQNVGESAAPAAPILCRLLQARDANLARSSAEALGNLAVSPEVSVPGLIQALTNSPNFDVIVGRKCAEALGQFGPQAAEAVPVLCAALKSDDGITAAEAARSLGRIGLNGELVIPDLIEYGRARRENRKYAIEGLAGYGPAASDAIPFLREALADEDHDTRELAKKTLENLGATP